MSEQQDTFISHLVELRDRLLRSLLAVGLAFIVLFLYPGSGPIYDFLASPLTQALPEGTKMIATGVITPFMVPVKVTALVALIVVLPYVLYQAWAFVAPGLYAHEKRLALPLVVASSVLFLAGIAAARQAWLAAGLLVWQGSYAAFSATTSNTDDAWSTGTMEIGRAHV